MTLFISFTDENFDKLVTKSKLPVVVCFSASWCAPCKALQPRLESLALEIPDVKVGKIDVEENPKTSSLFPIMSVPLVLLFLNGDVVAQITALETVESMIEEINEYLS